MRLIRNALVMLCVFVLGYIMITFTNTKVVAIESQYTLEIKETIITLINVQPNYSKFVKVKDKEGNEVEDIEIYIMDDMVNIHKEGTYPVLIAVYDEETKEFISKNAEVKVIVDNEQPTINIEYEKYYFEKGHIFSDNDFNIQITDNFDEDFEVEINYNNINVNEIGVYELSIIARDSSDNVSTEYITIEIVDKIPDVIIDDEIILEVFDNNDLENYLQIDGFYDENLIININDDELRSDVLGEYSVEIQSSFYNISSTKTIKVKVVDNTKPKIIGVEKIYIEKGSIFKWDKYFTIKDNYDKTENLKISIIGDYNIDKSGEYNLTISVEDLSGNTNQYSFILIVENKTNNALLWISIIFGVITLGAV